MPTIRDLCDARVIAAAVLVLIVTACGGQTTTSTATSAPSTSTSTTATARVTSTPSGPMTGDELVWLEGISTLHTNMDKIMSDAPPTVTEEMLRELAKPLAECTLALNRLGSITDRLQPVYDLAKQACAQYEKTAECFDAAKDCGFDELSKGSSLFAEAETKGVGIRNEAS